jgi:hypothetical protein
MPSHPGSHPRGAGAPAARRRRCAAGTALAHTLRACAQPRAARVRIALAWPGADTPPLSRAPSLTPAAAHAQVIHCRWAMLGAAGCIAPEFLGKAGIIPAATGLVRTRARARLCAHGRLILGRHAATAHARVRRRAPAPLARPLRRDARAAARCAPWAARSCRRSARSFSGFRAATHPLPKPPPPRNSPGSRPASSRPPASSSTGLTRTLCSWAS